MCETWSLGPYTFSSTLKSKCIHRPVGTVCLDARMGCGEIFTKEIMLQLGLKDKENLSIRQNGQHKLQDEELMKDMDLLENVFYNCLSK